MKFICLTQADSSKILLPVKEIQFIISLTSEEKEHLFGKGHEDVLCLVNIHSLEKAFGVKEEISRIHEMLIVS